MQRSRMRPLRPLLAAGLLIAVSAHAQTDFSKVEIETTELAPGLYMMTGAGGNLGVSVGEDGVFLVDDQYAPLTDKIRAAVAKLSDRPIRFVINTHWHFDHTGGNENLGQGGSVIVAHHNVRRRMAAGQLIELLQIPVEPAPPAALPVITYDEAVTFHLNGDDIHAFHVPPAHTDGDSVVHFRSADVIHMGDLFFNGMYPFVDLSSGGSVDGMVAAARRVLALCGDRTQIIPGHGPVTDRAGLAAYRDMLVGVRAAVAELIAAGHDKEAVVAAKPTAPWDEQWGGGFIQPDVFAGVVYDSLSR